MKKFLSGFLLGAVIFGSSTALAAGILAEKSNQDIWVDGEKIQMEAYNIGGNNYFKLRDIGKEMDFAVTFDSGKNAVMVDSQKTYAEGVAEDEKNKPAELKEEIEKQAQTTVLDVSPVFVNGVAQELKVQAGDVLYGTGSNGGDGYMTIKNGKPAEAPLQNYDTSAFPYYDEIVYPDPMPWGVKYTGSISGEKYHAINVFNAHETQRLVNELYKTFEKHPECWENGQLTCRVVVGYTSEQFDFNHFYPYVDSEVAKQVIGGDRIYSAYAIDVYVNGSFDHTRYMVSPCGFYTPEDDYIDIYEDFISAQDFVNINVQK